MNKKYIALIALIVALAGTLLVVGTFYATILFFHPSIEIAVPTPTGTHDGWVCNRDYKPEIINGQFVNVATTYHWGHDRPSYPDSYCPPWPAMATP